MAKQQTCQRYIVKIHSSRLRKAKWKLVLPLSEARANDELISLADSQVLRWLDELNGIVDADNQAREIRTEIKKLRASGNDISIRRAIKKLYADLDELQYKPDYLALIMDKAKDYYRACRGFTINGIKYERLLGTNGGIKNSTIIFIAERHAKEIKKRIENNRSPDKPMVPAKLEAYKALSCSASIPVSMPSGIIVVPDCKTKFFEDTIYLDDDGCDEPRMESRPDTEVEVDNSDGYGLMLPSLAEKWSADLRLGYVTSGVNTRFCWEKGMVYTFDFIEFAEKVAGSYIVKDVWGKERDIRNAELILTESMLKLWDSYDSLEEFLKCCGENKYTFAVTKACPDELESERTLNYQFIQSYDFTDDDIDELVKPTLDELREVLYADWTKSVLFLRGCGLRDDNIMNTGNIYAKALTVEPELLSDPYIKAYIYQTIKNRINEAKVGVLKVHGNYSMIGGDPYALCQSIFGLPVTGLLGKGEIYNCYWAQHGAPSLACYRAPMTCHNNIRLVRPCLSEEAGYWFRYIKTATLLNAWDTSPSALNGADFDGDTVMLTDNAVLLRKLEVLPTLMCVQRKAPKIIPTEADTVDSNIASFGDDIGKTTNWVTSMFEVRSQFPKDSEEYRELTYRIMCGQLYQQN